MAIRTVANASQLNAAIRSASSGDTIQLKAGNYGTVKIANSSKALSIESESAWNPATFKAVTVVKSSNLTLDNLEFQGSTSGGWGTGIGLKITDSRNIRVEDSDFQDFYKGVTASNSQGITVARNEFMRQSEDAMAFGNVNGLQILGNEVKGMKTPVQQHHDMIQITPVGGMSSNVVIRGNVLDSNDLITHGIYIGNSGGSYRNITIEDNKVIGGHLHGITVGKTIGLNINDNIVLRDGASGSTRQIDTPTINVANGSSNVKINGNTAYDINSPSGVGYNKIVPVSVKFSGSTAPDISGSTPGSPAPSPTPPSSSGNDDVFRFNGGDVRGWTKQDVRNVDLNGGDEIQFSGYDAGTFKAISGGNWLQVSGDGRSATIDSRADLKELIQASGDVKALDWGETLALRINQDDGTHAFVMQGIGDADYFL